MLAAYRNVTRPDNEWHVINIDADNGNAVTCLFVFNAPSAWTADDVLANWERVKQECEG